MATPPPLRPYSQSLAKAGYHVRRAGSLKEVEQACHSERFDLILVADALEPKVKRAIGMTIRHFLPEAPILQMGRTRPDIEGNCFVTGSSEKDVLRAIRRILRHDEIPPAAL